MMNILFTCAGRRNYLLEYFKEIEDVKVFACDADMNAPALYEADEWFIVPSITSQEYIPQLLKESKKNSIKAIISLNDIELPILAAHRNVFKKEGIDVVISENEVIDVCSDKFKTYEFSKGLSISSIPTFLYPSEAIEFQKNNPKCKFIVKPRWGSASIGLAFPESIDELVTYYDQVGMIVKSSLLSNMSTSIDSSSVIIQKRIGGQEYGMDVVNNLKGEYQKSLVRKKLAMRSGETNKAITVIDENFSQIGREIGNKLKHVGNLDCDLFIEKDEVYLLEMNPRFGGGYPFMHHAGANLPLAIVEWLRNKNISRETLNYNSGVASAKVDKIVRLG